MFLLELLPLFAVAYVMMTLVITASLYHAMRRPARFTYASAVARDFAVEPSELGLDAAEIELTDAQGLATPAWRIAGRKADGPVVLMLHGFARSRYSSLELAPHFVDHASLLVLPDLPGHGDSANPRSSAGAAEWRDVLGFIEQVRAPGRAVVLYGRSMGAGACIAAGAHGAGVVSGVIAEGAYRGWAGPIRRRMRLRKFPAEPHVTLAGLFYRMTVHGLGDFDRANLASRLDCPLLLLHGSDDQVCPLSDAEEIRDAAKHARLEVFEGGKHLDLHRIAPDRHRDLIARFLNDIPARDAAAPTPTTPDQEARCPTPH